MNDDAGRGELCLPGLAFFNINLERQHSQAAGFGLRRDVSRLDHQDGAVEVKPLDAVSRGIKTRQSQHVQIETGKLWYRACPNRDVMNLHMLRLAKHAAETQRLVVVAAVAVPVAVVGVVAVYKTVAVPVFAVEAVVLGAAR